ncbi:glycogenin glucosyltransferase [Fusarium poae]
MAVQDIKGEQIYATLLLSDSYLPGALVLAHSLRDAGATRKLAVLVTLDSVSEESITQLKDVYDYVFPVPRIRNDHPANLYLMNRSDLHSAFTKINLWKLTNFSKIVYIDADVVAYRAPEELFDISHPFAAAPDIGWPDLFNTGVMVLNPNMGDFYAMIAMAERGISFDGADQGLINMHFGQQYHRLSFTYNVTPSAHYQYVPAYRHFQSSINMVHFIGANKPWFTGRDAPSGSGPYTEMIGRWWAVYDRHYRHQENDSATQYVQYFTKGEWRPNSASTGQQQHGSSTTRDEHRRTQGIMMHDWDAQRYPPPSGSKPEAMNFPLTHYEMSRDTAPFVPPQRYPSPPKNMWYEVPKERPGSRSKAAPEIFPWERNQPRPTRTFAGEPEPEPEPSPEESGTQLSVKTESLTESGSETKNQSSTSTPTVQVTPSNPWTSYTRTNAWDEVPAIERYVDRLHGGGHRRGKSSTSSTGHVKSPTTGAWQDDQNSSKLRGLKLTDFPSAVERPSLPVTPAPVHRNTFFADDDAENEDETTKKLPEAEGVPTQSDWDPIEQLQKLAKQQSDVLLKRLGGDGEVVGGVC